MSTPQERLSKFIKSEFGTNKEFAKAMGINSSSDVSKYTKGNLVFGAGKLKKLSELKLNIDWYLTGEGEMLEEKSSLSNASIVPTSGKLVYLPKIAELSKEEKLKAREILKDYMNTLNDSLVDELK